MERIRSYLLKGGESPRVRTDLGGASPFCRRVWNELRKIRRGEVKSYGAVASAIGSSGAGRAVGRACAMNPLPLVIPCHRVVAKNSPGGFSSGMDWKIFLLALESDA